MNDKLTECQVMANLRHPHVLRFNTVFRDGDKLCILCDFCDRGDLETYIVK